MKIDRILLRLYPKPWRQRYGDEIQALLEDAPPTGRILLDLLRSAAKEQFHMQSFQRLAGWMSAAGLLAGFLISFAIPPRYTARATVSLIGIADLEAARTNVLSRASLATLIEQNGLYPEQRLHEPLEDIEDEMRQALAISVDHRGTTEVVFTYPDPNKAVGTVRAVTQIIQWEVQLSARVLSDLNQAAEANDRPYLEEIARLEARLAALEARVGLPARVSKTALTQAEPAPPTLRIVEEPNSVPVSPNRAAFAAAGFASGLLSAALIALFRGRNRWQYVH
jgi:LPS O-antigen subunit length determinant protein (WzzB/FepE family)